jgi:cytoskeletal protein CcmA (bactofilin family)
MLIFLHEVTAGCCGFRTTDKRISATSGITSDVATSAKVFTTASEVASAKITGTWKTEGEFRGQQVRVSGVLKSEAGIRGEEIDVSGVLKAEGDVQAERFRAEGPVTIDGELNAETVELLLTGESAIESIVGGSVTVRLAQETGLGQGPLHLNLRLPFLGNHKGKLGGGNRPHLAAELIEADEVELESTDCETVRGVNVRIGPECVIDRIEFSGSLTTAPDAVIREKIKV